MLSIARLKGGGIFTLLVCMIFFATDATADALDGEPPGITIVQTIDINVSPNLLVTDNPAPGVAIAITDIGETMSTTSATSANVYIVTSTMSDGQAKSTLVSEHGTTIDGIGSTTHDQVLRSDAAIQVDPVLNDEQVNASNMPPGTIMDAAGITLVEKNAFMMNYRLRAKRIANAEEDSKAEFTLSTAAANAETGSFYTRL